MPMKFYTDGLPTRAICDEENHIFIDAGAPWERGVDLSNLYRPDD